jgi:hypothetical protein
MINGRKSARKSQYMQGKGERRKRTPTGRKFRGNYGNIYNSLDRGKYLDPKGCRLPLGHQHKESSKEHILKGEISYEIHKNQSVGGFSTYRLEVHKLERNHRICEEAPTENLSCRTIRTTQESQKTPAINDEKQSKFTVKHTQGNTGKQGKKNGRSR